MRNNPRHTATSSKSLAGPATRPAPTTNPQRKRQNNRPRPRHPAVPPCVEERVTRLNPATLRVAQEMLTHFSPAAGLAPSRPHPTQLQRRPHKHDQRRNPLQPRQPNQKRPMTAAALVPHRTGMADDSTADRLRSAEPAEERQRRTCECATIQRLPASRMARSASILRSRSTMVWRLSCTFLPRASASSTLARPSLKYNDRGMSVRFSVAMR